mgnify:FL=1
MPNTYKKMKNTITEHPPLPFSLGRNHHAPSIVYTFIFTLNALMENQTDPYYRTSSKQ